VVVAPAAGGSAASVTTAGAGNPYLAREGEARVPLKVATCAVSGTALQLFTALEGNLFAKYGFDVERVVLQPPSAALAALASNEVQFLYCAVDATISGLGSGMDAKLVAGPLAGLPYVMIVRPDIRSFNDLRGKAIAITRPGDLDDRLSRLALERHGLVPNEDVDLRPIGGSQPERYRTVVSNIVQATAITPPLNAQAVKDGLNVLYELSELGLPFMSNAIQTNGTMLREQPQVVQRFVAAAGEAVHFASHNPELARASLRRVMEIEDPDTLEAAFQAYARKHANPRLRLDLEAVTASLEAARASGTPISVRGPEDVFTNQFAEDLERTGFLRSLWGAELSSR
jgi:NitT/TauT family transport system substrate-binding protein